MSLKLNESIGFTFVGSIIARNQSPEPYLSSNQKSCTCTFVGRPVQCKITHTVYLVTKSSKIELQFTEKTKPICKQFLVTTKSAKIEFNAYNFARKAPKQFPNTLFMITSSTYGLKTRKSAHGCSFFLPPGKFEEGGVRFQTMANSGRRGGVRIAI